MRDLVQGAHRVAGIAQAGQWIGKTLSQCRALSVVTHFTGDLALQSQRDFICIDSAQADRINPASSAAVARLGSLFVSTVIRTVCWVPPCERRPASSLKFEPSGPTNASVGVASMTPCKLGRA